MPDSKGYARSRCSSDGFRQRPASFCRAKGADVSPLLSTAGRVKASWKCFSSPHGFRGCHKRGYRAERIVRACSWRSSCPSWTRRGSRGSWRHRRRRCPRRRRSTVWRSNALTKGCAKARVCMRPQRHWAGSAPCCFVRRASALTGAPRRPVSTALLRPRPSGSAGPPQSSAGRTHRWRPLRCRAVDAIPLGASSRVPARRRRRRRPAVEQRKVGDGAKRKRIELHAAMIVERELRPGLEASVPVA